MLEQTPHQTNATASEEAECLEISRDDIAALLQQKPLAGMDLLTTLGRQFHASQELVRIRASRNPNEIIEAEETRGERVADTVASFGGSWTFIILFALVLTIYTLINIVLDKKAWDPYPFILLNLFLSMLAAVQAPVIMMSQNRQDKKDRLRGELDFDVNRRAESEIVALTRKLGLLDEKVDDLNEMLPFSCASQRQEGIAQRATSWFFIPSKIPNGSRLHVPEDQEFVERLTVGGGGQQDSPHLSEDAISIAACDGTACSKGRHAGRRPSLAPSRVAFFVSRRTGESIKSLELIYSGAAGKNDLTLQP